MTTPLFTQEQFDEIFKSLMTDEDIFFFECLSKTREQLEAELPNRMYDMSEDGFTLFTGKAGFINMIEIYKENYIKK